MQKARRRDSASLSDFLDPLTNEISQTEPIHEPPAWFDEFSSALSYADHLVLSGNVRDIYPADSPSHPSFCNLYDTLERLLTTRRVEQMLICDPVDGFRWSPVPSPELKASFPETTTGQTSGAASLGELAAVHAQLVSDTDLSIALIIDYATHLHGRTPDELEDFFVKVDKASRSSHSQRHRAGHRNPTIWIVDHPADLPDWFVVGNDYLREVQVEYPNLEDRFLHARHLMEEFAWDEDGSAQGRERFLQQFALETEGDTLLAMRAIADVMEDEGLGLDAISEAVRIHRTGSRRNPWTSPVLFSRVRQARSSLEERIKGQPRAIEKTLDILARSIMGLSGAQSGSRHQNPRGVLFFAGPTGVGKTELAKAVTDLLFGDETACQRFDMSEFMEEESVTRLIGAPPGRPGHERGGELVNAANRRPFSVFLFDEIEKAHPRILDMFLQILEDGRLTDSRGATAHFSQALIIFTSNIGVVGGAGAVNDGMNVLPSDSYDELEEKITRAVQDHFRKDLHRPEILNRIGQNVVVFDFLSHESASLIFQSILERVREAVNSQNGIRVELEDKAYNELKTLCIHDYFDGGRGIGNRIETHFINPLARQLFDRTSLSDLRITDVRTEMGKTRLIFGDQDGAVAQERHNSVPNAPAVPRRLSHDEIIRLRESHGPRRRPFSL